MERSICAEEAAAAAATVAEAEGELLGLGLGVKRRRRIVVVGGGGVGRVGGGGWGEMWFLVILSLLWMVGDWECVSGFNLDVGSAVTHRGQQGSMFGFSVAQHKDSNVSWILVGAPNADTRQPGVRRPGGVYRCSCESNDVCQLIPFDRLGNNIVEGKQIDEKSNQWFGATVRSSGDDGIILACAPRYTWFSTNRKRRDPVGTCFVAKDSFTEFVEYSPCRTSKWGYHRQGSCQVGLGADVDGDGRRLFLGAVGSWYWQGQLFLVDSRKTAGGNTIPFFQFQAANQGQVYSQGLVARPDIRWTREGPNWDDDSYLGYSVASGEFSGDRDSDVAVGMPRGANLTGKVVVYSSDLTNLHNITGEQIGSYFGYAIAVTDMDGDGLDDIIIGAPMHTDFGNPSMKIETGKVYIVYQTKRHKFKKWESVDGTADRGRFGLSLCALGDINRDGFGDFAVGAPYEDRGAVYIYQGSSTGLRREYTQVIYGREVQSTISTFGFALSGGKDLDGNGYPDLLAGAYDSDFVAYFKSRPVVRVSTKLTFTTHDQQSGGGVDLNSKQINLDEKACDLRDGTKVTCLPLNLCMEYDGIGADDSMDFNVQYILDSKKPKEPRMFFLNSEGFSSINQTLRLFKKRENCANIQVYLRPQIRDKLTPLEAELRYSMISVTTFSHRERRSLIPIIDATTSTVEKDSVSIEKNCGPDNICIPDLSLKVSMSEKSFLMGSTERINIEVEVDNLGEDSYESTLIMSVPSSLAYVSLDRLDTNKRVPVLCSPPTPSTNNTLRCDIGNPLPRYERVKFKLYFQPRYGSEVKSDYIFNISVNSTNPEQSDVARSDNYRSISLPVRIQTDLSLKGVSKPQPVRHNVSVYDSEKIEHENDVGPEVIHTYEIICDGPSSIESSSLILLWPSYTLEGEHFLYLLEQPHTEGPLTCEHVEDVNPLELILSKHNHFSGVAKDRTIGIDQEESIASASSSGSSSSSSFSSSGSGSGTGFGSASGSGSGGSDFNTFSNSSYEQRFSGGGGQYSKTSKTSYTERKTDSKTFQTSDELDDYLRNQGISGYRDESYRSQSPSYNQNRNQNQNQNLNQNQRNQFSSQSQSPSQSQSSREREASYGGGQARTSYIGSAGSSSGSSSGSYSSNPNYLHPQQPYQSSHQQQHYSDRDRDPYSRHERNKRQSGSGSGSAGWKKDTSCGPTKCIQIKCKIGELDAGQSVVLAVRGRVWSRTLQSKFKGENVNISSKLLTRVSQLPYNVDPSYLRYKTNEIVTTVIEETDLSKPGPVRWWIYVLAALAGLLLLLLIIYALYKCGFFKRRRPRHGGPDSQPLHRNGYHPGDERL